MSYLFDCYAGIYDSFMSFFHLNDTTIIEDYLYNKSLNILDVGGGSGLLADRLQRQGHHVTIVDSSQAMLNKAYQKNKEVRQIHSQLHNNLDIDYFDVVICRDCLHHLSHVNDDINIMMNYLKEDGELIIHDFNPKSWRIKLLFLFERCCFEKIHPISVNTLKHVCQDYQFSFLHIGKWDYICKIKR